MTLNYKKIEQAIAEEKNAGGFAELIKKFKALGIKKYDYFVDKGVYRYYDGESFVDSQMNGEAQEVGQAVTEEGIRRAVKKAQAGEVDFVGFCLLAGQAGISYWTSDLEKMIVSYFDQQDSTVLVEPIPAI
ncbi:DUF1398 family protein [Enterococcus larvae]|uniref:DUF1398 family protein n=1 Tax=Enterococcus larvae TaxID=2794352 RepID=UPI003F384E28